ncbi:MAG TPA: glycosyltransferase family 39 protein, partial [Pyrinomonadaceae bacterium]|nr:glycosyltransferase family 39 protein [Pyrinomonadaceae bacterium]
MGLLNRFRHRPLHTELILLAALCVAAYLISRTYAVTHIPIFIDEALHVDWARATAESYPPPDPGYEGKWFSIKLFALAAALPFPFNDLIAARLAVVAFSLTTMLACYLLGRDLFSPRVGVFSCLFFVVLPFTVIYSSLAMTDGLQLAFSSWAILLAVRLARAPRWSHVVALPLLLAAAILAKFSALLLLAVPVAAILLLTPRTQWLRAGLRVVPTFLTALGLLAWFYSSGLLQIVRTKTIDNFTGFTDQVWTNLTLAGSWLWGLLTPSITVLAVIAICWLLLRERSRAGLFVVTLLGLTVLPYVVISKTWYPRYLLTAVIPVVLAISQLLVA